jgi:hypothetical protein
MGISSIFDTWLSSYVFRSPTWRKIRE